MMTVTTERATKKAKSPKCPKTKCCRAGKVLALQSFSHYNHPRLELAPRVFMALAIEDQLRHMPRLLDDRVGGTSLGLVQLVCVSAEQFPCCVGFLGRLSWTGMLVMFSPRVDRGVGQRTPMMAFWAARTMALDWASR